MIIDLQRRIMEAGRIRIGHQVPTSSGHTRPAKLDTFRLTSADKTRIEQAAQLYGGEVKAWKAPAGPQWEVVTETKVLNVIVPPSDMAFSQSYELWSAGGCLRRCDSAFEQLSDQPCLCDPEARECTPHTRLSVLLRDLKGLGLWRLDTQGYYAAVELAGAVQVIAVAAGRGALLPARLRVDERAMPRRVDGKVETHRFVVPVLDIDISPGELLALHQRPLSLDLGVANGENAQSIMLPVPPAPEWPVEPVAEQAAIVDVAPPKSKRSNAAQPIPPTGLAPRTMAEAQQQASEAKRVTKTQVLPDLDPERPFESDAGPTLPLDLTAVGSDAVSDDDAERWADLYRRIHDGIDTSQPMKVVQAEVRELFELMTAVELWKPGADGSSPLQLALTKVAGTTHLTELKQAQLHDFTALALKAAREAIWKATN